MSLPTAETNVDTVRSEPAERDGVVLSVLALTILTPCLGGALDNRVQGIAALMFEGGAILLAAALAYGARCVSPGGRVTAFLWSGVNALVLLWLAVVFGSRLLAPAASVVRPYSMQEALRQAAGVVIYFAVSLRFRRTVQMVQLARALLVVGMLASVAGFVQYSRYDSGMATGPFHDHQLCGSCLAILLPVVASMAFGRWATNRLLVAQAATALIAICLLLTYARSAWVGAAVGMGTLFALATLPWLNSLQRDYIAARHDDNEAARRASSNRRQGRYRSHDLGARKHEFAFPIMVSLAVIGFVAVLASRGSGVNDRIGTFARLATDQSWSRRLQAWSGAAQMIAERPLSGFGVGAYPVLQQRYTRLSVAIDRSGGRPSLAEQAHNVYLETAVEVGVPGMILFAAAPVAFILQGVGRLRRMQAGPRKSLLQGAIGSMVAFIVDACASPAWQCSQISILFWLVLGLGTCCLRTPRRPRAAHTDDTMRPAPLPIRGAGVACCLLLLLLLPTAALSVSGTFPDHVAIVATENGNAITGRQVELRLFLVNTDGSRRDITNAAATTFHLDGAHGGDLRKVSGRVLFQPTIGENTDVVIKGIYSGARPDVIEPKDRDTCRIGVRPTGAQGG